MLLLFGFLGFFLLSPHSGTFKLELSVFTHSIRRSPQRIQNRPAGRQLQSTTAISSESQSRFPVTFLARNDAPGPSSRYPQTHSELPDPNLTSQRLPPPVPPKDWQSNFAGDILYDESRMLALNQLQEERDRQFAEKLQAGDDRKVALLMLQNEVRGFSLTMVTFPDPID